MTTEPDSIEVATEPDLDGTYRTTVHYTNDISYGMDAEGAVDYALAWIAACAAADTDAAIAGQLAARGLDGENVALMVVAMRERRDLPPTIGPVTVTPLVNKDHIPFLRCEVEQLQWQWSTTEATQHALHVLETAAIAPLDDHYRAVLGKTIDLDEPTAAAVVGDLRNYRSDTIVVGPSVDGLFPLPDTMPAARTPESGDAEHSTERLARALAEVADPDLASMIIRAREGYYHDFLSPLAHPASELIRDLTALGHNELAARARKGEFDATAAETEAWRRSPEGRAAAETVGLSGEAFWKAQRRRPGPQLP